jgi:hypothetical protein
MIKPFLHLAAGLEQQEFSYVLICHLHNGDAKVGNFPEISKNFKKK